MPIEAPPRRILETGRLRLAPGESADTIEIFDLLARNHEHFARWNPVVAREELSADFALDLLASEARGWAQGELLRLWIRLRDPPQTLVGWIKLDALSAGAFHSGRLGYAIDAAHQGRGLMREALTATLRFAFGQEVNLHRLQASVLPENAASLRVLRASGFEDIGVARNYLRVGGRWRDHLLTQRINPAWREPSVASRVT